MCIRHLFLYARIEMQNQMLYHKKRIHLRKPPHHLPYCVTTGAVKNGSSMPVTGQHLREHMVQTTFLNDKRLLLVCETVFISAYTNMLTHTHNDICLGPSHQRWTKRPVNNWEVWKAKQSGKGEGDGRSYSTRGAFFLLISSTLSEKSAVQS